MDERPIEMSFRGTLRGGVRNRIFGHYLDSDTLDLESMRWDLQADGPVSFFLLMRVWAIRMTTCFIHR